MNHDVRADDADHATSVSENPIQRAGARRFAVQEPGADHDENRRVHAEERRVRGARDHDRGIENAKSAAKTTPAITAARFAAAETAGRARRLTRYQARAPRRRSRGDRTPRRWPDTPDQRTRIADQAMAEDADRERDGRGAIVRVEMRMGGGRGDRAGGHRGKLPGYPEERSDEGSLSRRLIARRTPFVARVLANERARPTLQSCLFAHQRIPNGPSGSDWAVAAGLVVGKIDSTAFAIQSPVLLLMLANFALNLPGRTNPIATAALTSRACLHSALVPARRSIRRWRSRSCPRSSPRSAENCSAPCSIPRRRTSRRRSWIETNPGIAARSDAIPPGDHADGDRRGGRATRAGVAPQHRTPRGHWLGMVWQIMTLLVGSGSRRSFSRAEITGPAPEAGAGGGLTAVDVAGQSCSFWCSRSSTRSGSSHSAGCSSFRCRRVGWRSPRTAFMAYLPLDCLAYLAISRSATPRIWSVIGGRALQREAALRAGVARESSLRIARAPQSTLPVQRAEQRRRAGARGKARGDRRSRRRPDVAAPLRARRTACDRSARR